MWPVAVITFLEGIRSRLFFGVFLFSFLIMGMSLVFVNLFMHNLSKIAVDFNLSSISFAGLLISLSLTVNLVSKDIQSRTIYFVLSKPISRASYIFGKFVGVSLLTFVTYLVLTICATLTLLFLKFQIASGFNNFSWLACGQAVFLDFIKISLFNGLIIFLSTITSSSFITMLFGIALYVIGQSLSTVVAYLSLGQTSIVSVPTSIAPIVTVLNYLLPNFSIFDNKILAAHGITLSLSEMLLFTGYGIGYTTMLLSLAAWIFSKKELS